LASTVSEFTSNGKIVTSFNDNWNARRRAPSPSVFVGGVVPRAGGFVFVGAGQADLIGMSPERSVAGRVIPFNTAGFPAPNLDGTKLSKFSSVAYWNEWAFARSNGGYLMIGEGGGSRVDALRVC
jgi:hypothetical protein